MNWSHLITTFGLSIRQACRSLNLSRTVYHYRADIIFNVPVITALHTAAEQEIFRCFFMFRGGRDTCGSTKGSTVFTVC